MMPPSLRDYTGYQAAAAAIFNIPLHKLSTHYALKELCKNPNSTIPFIC